MHCAVQPERSISAREHDAFSEDVNEINGGILLIFGSLKYNGSGSAVNHSDRFRYVMTNSRVESFIRQQENFLLTVSPEGLANASDKLLWRLGFHSHITANLVEGYGYQGTGKMGDFNGSVAHVRCEIAAGNYQHVGALIRDDVTKISADYFALARIQRQNETFRTPEHIRKMMDMML